ncbi:MAG: TetR/AcrR family transcriptional regulator [Lachnospiraceae bacterium]|nr:TetR/AcrR family transcriptional regulator [Lachnospiraceae bacterium]
MAVKTKEIIIQTVMELLNERSFTKITVKDIVERCGINRNTFYYHFRDISDVMEFVFKREMDRIMETHLEADNVFDGLVQVVELLQENRRALLHIYRSLDRAVLQHQLDVMCEYIVSNYVLKARDYIDITKLPQEDQRLMRSYQKCLLMGILLDWMENGMKEELAADMKHVMNALKQVPPQT